MYRIVLLLAVIFTFSECSASEKKEIKASSILEQIKKGNHIHFNDKIIVDDLNFSDSAEPFIFSTSALQTEIKSNIFFSNCIFLGKVTANEKKSNIPVRCKFNNNLIFFNFDFRDEVNFNGAIVFGMNFSKSTFREKTDFNNIAVWAKDSYFQEINAEKEFTLINALIFGNLYFQNSVFKGKTSFQSASVKGTLMFNYCTFEENAGLDLMETGGDAFFNHVQFAKWTNFSWSRFMNTTNFANAIFENKATFEKTIFLNTVDFEGVDKTHLIFTDAFFLISE
jgi:hypothetical protein